MARLTRNAIKVKRQRVADYRKMQERLPLEELRQSRINKQVVKEHIPITKSLVATPDDPFGDIPMPRGIPKYKPTWPLMRAPGGVEQSHKYPVAHDASRRMARGGKVILEPVERDGPRKPEFKAPNWDRLRDPILIEKNHSRMLFLYRPDASGSMWMFRRVTPTGEQVSIGYFSEGKARWALETNKIIWQQS